MEYDKPIRVESGYRCPHGNADVGGVVQSFHTQGRASDLFSSGTAWTQTEFDLMAAAADTTSPTERFEWTSYSDHHLHVAW